MGLIEGIASVINDHVESGFKLVSQQGVAGGCINTAFLLSGEQGNYFVKVNSASKSDMFSAEADGLREMASAQAIRVPNVICQGEADGQAFLVLEALDLASGQGHRQLGHQLAAMHNHTQSQFGWFRDNTIGATLQKNALLPDWVSFFRDQRLGFQFELAQQRGYRGRLFDRGDRLMADIEALFSNHKPQASLLHGDLWSGNYAFHHGEPVIFDPAVYYGDAEADIAMTELFGGFQQDFYAAYQEIRPLDEDYRVRKTLYNLYHILNHLNLFGGGYQSQAESMVDRAISEIN